MRDVPFAKDSVSCSCELLQPQIPSHKFTGKCFTLNKTRNSKDIQNIFQDKASRNTGSAHSRDFLNADWTCSTKGSNKNFSSSFQRSNTEESPMSSSNSLFKSIAYYNADQLITPGWSGKKLIPAEDVKRKWRERQIARQQEVQAMQQGSYMHWWRKMRSWIRRTTDFFE